MSKIDCYLMYYLWIKFFLIVLDNFFLSFGLVCYVVFYGEEGVGRLLCDNSNNGFERN